ncbi:MAG TPA: hypothetical protein VFE45_10845, partial [Coriobacteriia bacterium]|nr:hypothetical protein [Coriobacteriia bacterium]
MRPLLILAMGTDSLDETSAAWRAIPWLPTHRPSHTMCSFIPGPSPALAPARQPTSPAPQQ